MSEETERMMKWFAYEHLKPEAQATSKPFHDLATHICQNVQSGPERTAALRKLLESKDCAVRATIIPGG